MGTLEYYTDIIRYAEGLIKYKCHIFSKACPLQFPSQCKYCPFDLSLLLLLLSRTRRPSGPILQPLTSLVSCTSALKIESPPPKKKPHSVSRTWGYWFTCTGNVFRPVQLCESSADQRRHSAAAQCLSFYCCFVVQAVTRYNIYKCTYVNGMSIG